MSVYICIQIVLRMYTRIIEIYNRFRIEIIPVVEGDFLMCFKKFHMMKLNSKLWECNKKLSKTSKKLVAIMQKYGRINVCILGRCTQSRIITGFSKQKRIL